MAASRSKRGTMIGESDSTTGTAPVAIIPQADLSVSQVDLSPVNYRRVTTRVI